MIGFRKAPTPKRKVRSYVLRTGRMTPAQLRGLSNGWSLYGLELSAGRIDYACAFPEKGDVVLEIGFGMGHAFVGQAQRYPSTNFIGVEVHTPGVGRVLNEILRNELQNIRLFREDVHDVLAVIPDNSLMKVQIFFPDPWPKKRHNKRRLIQETFIRAIAAKIKLGGQLQVVTDWVPYAEHIEMVMHEVNDLFQPIELLGSRLKVPRLETRFEQRGKRLGHEVTDFIYERI